MLVEPKHLLDEGVVTKATLINPKATSLCAHIANVTGYTQQLSKNLEVGHATEVSVVQSSSQVAMRTPQLVQSLVITTRR